MKPKIYQDLENKVELENGVVPIQKGGTGANTPDSAVANLGARPDTWTPNAAEVGARSENWMPTAEDVGAAKQNDFTSHTGNKNNPHGVTATQVGARPNTWMPTAADVGALAATGTAAAATKLATARTIRTNLGSTSTASFNGTANITPGVTGILPVANGGTGVTTIDALKELVGGGGGQTIVTGTYTGGVTTMGTNKTVDLGCTPKWVLFFPIVGNGNVWNQRTTLASMLERYTDLKDYDTGSKWGSFSGDVCYNTMSKEAVGLVGQGQTLKIENGYSTTDSYCKETLNSTYTTAYCGSYIASHIVASLSGSTLTVGNGKYVLKNESYKSSNAKLEEYNIQYIYMATYAWIAGL